MQAKYFKLLSHRIFPCGRLAWRYRPLAGFLAKGQRYDVLVWIDGSVIVKSPSFIRELVRHIGPSGWAMFRHPDRDCIYDEVEAAAPMKKYWGLPMREQVAHYQAAGYPRQYGLMACGIIARRSNDSRLRLINEAWWRENIKWTYQDQLSLPFVLWRLGAGCERVDLNLWDNPWFGFAPHKSEL